jgi:hypothetical protein
VIFRGECKIRTKQAPTVNLSANTKKTEVALDGVSQTNLVKHFPTVDDMS